MRDLAQINTIKALFPIPEATNIELATFEECAWAIIVMKGEFIAGDRCVRVEVDSVLPVRPEFEFLRPRCWKESWNGFVIKAIKMKGTISQGICFPLGILPEKARKKVKAGDDVTELLEIRKYESGGADDATPRNKGTLPFWVKFLMQFSLTREIARKYIELRYGKKDSGSFPSNLIAKTDETQIQNCARILAQYAQTPAYCTIKLEGQSATYLLEKGKKEPKFLACSRNISYPTRFKNNYWDIEAKYGIEAILRKKFNETGKLYAIQGEITGPGIQKNIYGWPALRFNVFTVKDLSDNRLLGHREIHLFLQGTGLEFVPVLWEGVLGDKIPDVTTALAMSEQYTFVHTQTGKKILDEGIVVRGMENEFSFKVRNPTYVFNWTSKD